jgi:hypothetical protein
VLSCRVFGYGVETALLNHVKCSAGFPAVLSSKSFAIAGTELREIRLYRTQRTNLSPFIESAAITSDRIWSPHELAET